MIVREDLALEAVYWAQLPGNMRAAHAPRRDQLAEFRGHGEPA